MKTEPPSLEQLSRQDRLRMAAMLSQQPSVTRELWLEQIKVFEKAGRDTASSLPFWRKWFAAKRG
jgi:hypothetical protein